MEQFASVHSHSILKVRDNSFICCYLTHWVCPYRWHDCSTTQVSTKHAGNEKTDKQFLRSSIIYVSVFKSLQNLQMEQTTISQHWNYMDNNTHFFCRELLFCLSINVINITYWQHLHKTWCWHALCNAVAADVCLYSDHKTSLSREVFHVFVSVYLSATVHCLATHYEIRRCLTINKNQQRLLTDVRKEENKRQEDTSGSHLASRTSEKKILNHLRRLMRDADVGFQRNDRWRQISSSILSGRQLLFFSLSLGQVTHPTLLYQLWNTVLYKEPMKWRIVFTVISFQLLITEPRHVICGCALR